MPTEAEKKLRESTTHLDFTPTGNNEVTTPNPPFLLLLEQCQRKAAKTEGLNETHMVSFEAQKFLILMKSSLSIFSFVAHAFGVISKNLLSNSRS